MTAETFLAWLEEQPTWRYELVDGQIVAMNPQRLKYINVKILVVQALQRALVGREDCHVVGDGMCVRVSDKKVYEPDALVYTGPEKDGETTVMSDPIVVVEILSPGTKTVDTTKKLEGYFRLASVRHYLIVDPASRTIVHHARDEHSAIATSLHEGGEIALDAIGASVAAAACFPSA